MKDSFPIAAYGSAADLPSIIDLREQVTGAKLLTRFIGRKYRTTFVAIETQLAALVQLVDDFYDLLGPRHWVFPE
jgi:hypothetical protein